MQTRNSCHEIRPLVEALENRTLASAVPQLIGQRMWPTHTSLTVDAGTLGGPISFNVTELGSIAVVGPLYLYFRGKAFQDLSLTIAPSPNPRFQATEATYTLPAGTAGAEMFGVGPHLVRAQFVGTVGRYYSSSAVAVFRVTRPQFVTQSTGVGTATLAAGSGPVLQAGQTATIRYNAYLAASYRLFDSSASHTPDTTSFVVDATPDQVIPGLDAGVVGMQAGETRAIYVPYALGFGKRGASGVPPRANLVYLVTLVSIG